MLGFFINDEAKAVEHTQRGEDGQYSWKLTDYWRGLLFVLLPDCGSAESAVVWKAVQLHAPSSCVLKYQL